MLKKLYIAIFAILVSLSFLSSNVCAFDFSGTYNSLVDKAKEGYDRAKDKVSDMAGEYFGDNKSDTAKNSETTDDPFFNKLWNELGKVSDQAVEIASNRNPRQKTTLEYITFQEPKFDRLLKTAREILTKSKYNSQFAQIEEYQQENKNIQKNITELRKQRISAPTSSMNPLTDTKSKIDKKIAELKENITSNELAIKDLKNDILEALHSRGINLSAEELNYFILSAEGEELIQLMTIAENMKKVQQIIENELATDKNPDLAKVYTGMYMVSLAAYATAHDTAIKNINNYRSRIENIRNESNKNLKDSKRLIKTVDDRDRSNAESNMKISLRTIEVADMYDKLLARRTKNLSQSKSKLDKKVELAWNTYKTISNSVSLIELINNGDNDYSLIVNFEMPELKSMYDDAIMATFIEISDKIKNEQS